MFLLDNAIICFIKHVDCCGGKSRLPVEEQDPWYWGVVKSSLAKEAQGEL